jgi:hypothetical protein
MGVGGSAGAATGPALPPTDDAQVIIEIAPNPSKIRRDGNDLSRPARDDLGLRVAIIFSLTDESVLG